MQDACYGRFAAGECSILCVLFIADGPLWEMFVNDFWGNRLRPPNDESDPNGNRTWWSHLSYRPLTVATLRLNYELNGIRRTHDPGPFHATNILLQAASCVAVVPILTALTGKKHVAGSELEPTAVTVAAGLLFASHPLHVESVANVTHRAEVLCAILLFLCWSAYARARAAIVETASQSRSCSCARLTTVTGWLVVAAVLHILALLAKETAIVFPAIAVVIDVVLSAHQRSAVLDCTSRLANSAGSAGGTLGRKVVAAWVSPLRDAVHVLLPVPGPGRPAWARWALIGRCCCLILWAAAVYYTRVVLLTGGYSLDMQSMHNPISLLADPFAKLLSVALVQAFAMSLLLWPGHLSHEHNAIRPVLSLGDTRNLFTVAVWAAVALLLVWAASSGNVWQLNNKDGSKPKSPSKAHAAPTPLAEPNPVNAFGKFHALLVHQDPTEARIDYDECRTQVCIEPARPLARRWRLLAGLGVAIVAYLPASHLLVRVGFVLAERQMYLPSIGGAVVLAEVLCGIAERVADIVVGYQRQAQGSPVFLGKLLNALLTIFPVTGLILQTKPGKPAETAVAASDKSAEADEDSNCQPPAPAAKELAVFPSLISSPAVRGGGEAFEAKPGCSGHATAPGNLASVPYPVYPSPPTHSQGTFSEGALSSTSSPVIASPPRRQAATTRVASSVRDVATSTEELEAEGGSSPPSAAASRGKKVKFAIAGRVLRGSPVPSPVASSASPSASERRGMLSGHSVDGAGANGPAPSLGMPDVAAMRVNCTPSSRSHNPLLGQTIVPVPVVLPGCRPRLGSPGTCVFWLAVAVCAGGFSLRAMMRAPAWTDDATLSRDLVDRYPENNPMGRYGLGMCLFYALDFDAALPLLIESARLSPFAEPRFTVSDFLLIELLPALRARDRGAVLSDSSTLGEMHRAIDMQELVGGAGVLVLGLAGSHWRLPDYAVGTSSDAPWSGGGGPEVYSVNYTCPNGTLVSVAPSTAWQDACAHSLGCSHGLMTARAESVITAARRQLNITTVEQALQAINVIQGYAWSIDANRREMYQNLALVRGLGGFMPGGDGDPRSRGSSLPMRFPVPEEHLLGGDAPGMQRIVGNTVRAPLGRLFRETPFPEDRDPTAGPASFMLPDDRSSPLWTAELQRNRTEYLFLVAEVGSVLPPNHPKRPILQLNAGVGRILSHPRRWGRIEAGVALLERAAAASRHGHRRLALSTLACFWATQGRFNETVAALRRFAEISRSPLDDDEAWEVPREGAAQAELFVTSPSFSTVAAQWVREKMTSDPLYEGPRAYPGPHIAYRAEQIGCRFFVSPVPV